jgi:hypothetical protein
MDVNDPIGRLARQIDAARKAEHFQVNVDTVTETRRKGAAELHRICAEFAAAVNSRLTEALLEIAPPAITAEGYREPGANVIQISSQGRVLQIVFQAPAEAASTEKFLIPYVLEGEVRAYNQKLLERSEIRSYMLYYCVENDVAVWRYFDWRTRSTGLLGIELLTRLMEPLFLD